MDTYSTSSPVPLKGARFLHQYRDLGANFYKELAPTRVRQPTLIAVNGELAAELCLEPDQLEQGSGLEVLAGNRLAEGSQPLAAAYAGHQFGYFNPELGDGRALLLGELIDRQGTIRDLQLKGSGPTPWSRGGDGRAAVGPVIREYLVSEAMYALGVRTTRTLAAVATGETVYRDRPLPGAVLTRVAASHVRIGTFEYFRARGMRQSLKKLFDFTVARHFPDCADHAQPQVEFLRQVQAAQIDLIASWMSLGFIHGVMNTDNAAISGETLDYGPCAFMEVFDPDTVFSSIDQHGRYAYNNQPNIALWNLTRLAECLLKIMPDNEQSVAAIKEVLEGFGEQFNHCWLQRMGRKLGFASTHQDLTLLLQEYLSLLQDCQVDFTLGFRSLCEALDESQTDEFRKLFASQPQRLQHWHERWRRALNEQRTSQLDIKADLEATNPLYIPRNHKIEQAINDAQTGDYTLFRHLLRTLSQPFTRQEHGHGLERPAPPGQEVLRTFCGT